MKLTAPSEDSLHIAPMQGPTMAREGITLTAPSSNPTRYPNPDLVKKRGVAKLEASQVTNHCLKGHEALEAALRNLRLVWRVLRVPPRVFEHVALDDTRQDGAVITKTNHRNERISDHDQSMDQTDTQ